MRASRLPALGAAEDDRDDVPVVAPQRRDEIEPGSVGVAGLDAVHPFDPAEQLVVIADRLAAIGEGAQREIPE